MSFARLLAWSMFIIHGAGLVYAHPLPAQTDVIRGRITSARDNAPILGAVVQATSLSGNVSRRATTNSDGRFTITFPGGEGDYWITVGAIGFAPRRFELKRVADESVLIADARLGVMALDTIVVATERRRRPERRDTTSDVSGTERPINPGLVPPDQAGDMAAMAATAPGVTYIPGTNGDPSGFSVLGLSSDQNQTTLNGMLSSVTNVPRDAGLAASVATSPYDVSQGGFSGGRLNLHTLPGSNYVIQSMSVMGNVPQLEWTDRAGRSLGQEYTNASLGGLFSGPLSYDRAFYNVSYQLGRRASNLTTLLNADPLGLQTVGVAADSVANLLGTLARSGVPADMPDIPRSRLTDQGSVFGSFDFAPPSSPSSHTLNVTVNGSWNRLSPATQLTTQLPASSSRLTMWDGSAHLTHTAYFGFLLSETALAFSESRRYTTPYLALPAGTVLVHSDFADSTSAIQPIQFGGSTVRNTATTTSLGLNNELSWFSGSNRHRIKLTTEMRRDGWSTEQSNELLGTFVFNSLAGLDAARPSTFVRQLAPVATRGGELVGALALGDAWRPTRAVQIVYGVRLDGNHYEDSPTLNPILGQLFGATNDHVPNGIGVSPRLGFSWTYGTSPQIGPFQGAARIPRGVIRAGIGVFQNSPGAELTNQAMTTTGLANGIQQITCVGDAAPSPNWSAYAGDPSSIPTQCADGSPGTVFDNGVPNIVLFAPDYSPQRAVRSTVQWSHPILGNRMMATVNGTYSLNLNQPGFVDLNFNPTARFTLPDEGGRPVYVQDGSIVPASGATAIAESRLHSQFNHVTERRSDFRSVSRQVQLQFAPAGLNSRFVWGLAYTLNSIRDHANGFSSTAASPLDRSEARASADWRHQLQVNFGVNLFDLFRVNWTQRFTSGTPYTPLVSGDINGDGYTNDRAFIADPAGSADTALAAAMGRLLTASSGAVRTCLTSQIGHAAARNSCEGPWTSTGFLTLAFNPLKLRLPQRASLSIQVANPLGAADLVLHGSGNLHGWGQAPLPDPRLLIVRGFDPLASRFLYDVNQRFGSSNQSVSPVRNPVAITLSLRIDLGPTRERQNLTQSLDRGRTRAGTKMPEAFLRSVYGSAGIINPIAVILAQADSLRLSGRQADSIATLNRWYVIRLDSIWRPVTRHLATLPDHYDQADVYRRYRSAREASVDLLIAVAPDLRSLLTPAQQRKLPGLIAAYLDRRYLTAVRSGTSGTPGGVFAPGSGGPGGMFGSEVIFMR
jgi:hypothetical protein